MKKYLLPALLLPISIGAIFAFNHASSKGSAPAADSSHFVPVRTVQENTRHPFTPQFTALNIPEEEKQRFTVNTKNTQVITGKSGSLLLIPAHAFKTKSGALAEGNVKLELVEGIATADILKMNLGTMSDRGMLETGGMVYVGATDESGEELSLAENKTIDVEIPTNNLKPGMQLWEGKVLADGSVSWQNPQPLKNSLREVPLKTLEPEQQGKAQPAGTNENKDEKQVVRAGRSGFFWDISAAGGWRIISGDTLNALAADSNVVLTANTRTGRMDIVRLDDKKFLHTNIATVEFRSRLPIIRQACDPRILNCYTDFPDRALWKSDAAAADSLDKTACPLAGVFREFAKMKQEKVDPKDPATASLLDQAREKAVRNYSKRVLQQAKKNAAAYPGVYSFGMTTLGWANCDVLCGAKNPKTMKFNTRFSGANGQTVSTQLIVPGRNIFIPGYKRPNGDFSYTHGEFEQEMTCPVGEKAYVLAKAGSGTNFFYVLKEISFGEKEIEQIQLAPGDETSLDALLASLFSDTDRVLDDWYTRQIRLGTGCVCGSGGVVLGWGAVK